MQAVILAAGRGNRLRPLTDTVPKSLVEINGKTFLRNDLEALSRHSEIEEVIIVVGYKKELIKETLGDKFGNIAIRYVDNDDWHCTNNIYSLWLASSFIIGDFILMEGDIFIRHKIIDCIFSSRDKNIAFLSPYHLDMSGTVVQIDDKGSKMASKTLVEVNESEHRIRRVIPSSEQDTHFDYSNKFKTVNIYYFTSEFFNQYFKPSLNLYLETHKEGNYYELIIGILVYLNTPHIYGHVVDRNDWYEVDTENDLEMANYLFSEKAERIDKLANLYGGYWRYDFLDFCFLFNLYFPPQHFYHQLGQDLPLLINNYPSAQHKISNLLAQWYNDDGFNKDNILVGNGASEFIKIINKQLVDKVTIPVPTFNEYEDLEPGQINYFPLSAEAEFRLDPSDFIDSTRESGSNFALIINPNNPTSTLTPRDDILEILEGLKELDGVLIDESFIDFSGQRERHTVQAFVERYNNLVVVRSLSKEFGVPGLRLGYVLTSNSEIKVRLKEYLPIWNINSIAERFIELFPRYQNEYNESIRQIIEDRKRFVAELNGIRLLNVIGSQANFLFCRIEDSRIDSTALRGRLFSEYNILVKDCSNKTSLDNRYVRIAVRKTDQNIRLVEACRQIERELR